MQQHSNARKRSGELQSPEAGQRRGSGNGSGPVLRRGSGKNGVNNRTIGRDRGSSDECSKLEQVNAVVGMRVGKVRGLIITFS